MDSWRRNPLVFWVFSIPPSVWLIALFIAPLAIVAFLLRPFVPGVYKEHCHLREASSPRVLLKNCLVVEAIKPIV